VFASGFDRPRQPACPDLDQGLKRTEGKKKEIAVSVRRIFWEEENSGKTLNGTQDTPSRCAWQQEEMQRKSIVMQGNFENREDLRVLQGVFVMSFLNIGAE